MNDFPVLILQRNAFLGCKYRGQLARPSLSVFQKAVLIERYG
jgi:hypothetical protein|tara:strand:- start:514 stop:639 length:126 start_codon:yes stop_codon:yes gene_type:complete